MRKVRIKRRNLVMFFCMGILWIGIITVLGLACGRILAAYSKDEIMRKEGKEGDISEENKDFPIRTEWNLLLVNRDQPLPEDYYIPAFTDLRNGHAVDNRIYPELQAMMDAARAEGLEPLICSSYRAWDKQQELYIQKVRSYVAEGHSWETALELAQGWVQKPGCSEHQTGMALDIVDTRHQLLDETQADTSVQQWLMEHCHEYGFILRYPKEKEGITGVNYEPWHYRYVGKEAAEVIMGEGICLEEYLRQP